MIVIRASYALMFVFLVALTALAQGPDPVVQWSVKIAPSKPLKAGQIVKASLNAKIEEGWHVYSITQAPGGPMKTEITVPAGQAITLAGPVTGPTPQTAYDSNFEINTEFYENSATFNVPLGIDRSANSGPVKGTIDVRFQTCNERLCLPPATTHVPVTMTIAAGSADRKSPKQSVR